ncbi:MAG: hypothetical protein HXK63_08315 [Campylobacter sp.]|nr:hypothetical protein [Campylobacter sp.]
MGPRFTAQQRVPKAAVIHLPELECTRLCIKRWCEVTLYGAAACVERPRDTRE